MSDDNTLNPPHPRGQTSGLTPTASGSPQHHSLDARNLLCPMPVIRTQDRVAQLNQGDELTITATDPGTLHDVPAWCRVHGHSLLEARQDGREFVVRLRVN